MQNVSVIFLSFDSYKIASTILLETISYVRFLAFLRDVLLHLPLYSPIGFQNEVEEQRVVGVVKETIKVLPAR